MAELKEVSISYSAGMKASLPQNRFESAQVYVSRSETYQLADGDDPDELFKERYKVLQSEIGDLCVEKYNEIKGGEL